MEQVMKIYGGFLLEAAVAVLLLLLLFSQLTDADGNSGVIRIVGANIASEHTDYSNYSDFISYVEDSGKMPPVIFYTGDSRVCVGDGSWRRLLGAQDCTGVGLEVQIISVTDSSGIEIPCNDGGELAFPRAGIYQVRATAVDARNRRTTSVINIPVNE